MDKLLVVVLIAAVACATGYAVRAIFRTWRKGEAKPEIF